MSRNEEFYNAGEQRQVMRGIAVPVSEPLRRHINQLTRMPLSEGSIGREFGLGDTLFDHIQESHPAPATLGLGLGRHWTTQARGIAEIAAGRHRGGSHLPVILHGLVDPRGTTNEGMYDEFEITLPRGHRVQVNGMEIAVGGGQRWMHVLDHTREGRA